MADVTGKMRLAVWMIALYVILLGPIAMLYYADVMTKMDCRPSLRMMVPVPDELRYCVRCWVSKKHPDVEWCEDTGEVKWYSGE